jgi:hypothetical protein
MLAREKMTEVDYSSPPRPFIVSRSVMSVYRSANTHRVPRFVPTFPLAIYQKQLHNDR